jgi:hypothetical protein
MEDISGSWQLAQPYGARQGPTSPRSLARGRSDAASIPRFPPAPEVWQGDALAWAGSLSRRGRLMTPGWGDFPTRQRVRSGPHVFSFFVPVLGTVPCGMGTLGRLWAFGCCFLALLPATGSHQHTKSGTGTHRPSFHGSLSARQVPTSTRSLARGLHCLAALPAPGSHQHTQSGTGTPLAMVRPGPSASDRFPPALEVWHGDSTVLACTAQVP